MTTAIEPTCICDGNGSVACWHCSGDGAFHDCGEDCCACLEPELDLNVTCEVCDGEGHSICPVHNDGGAHDDRDGDDWAPTLAEEGD